jgi:acetyl esterase/lipase
VFRDEVVHYAGKVWAAGGGAELHVRAGGFHGFDVITPETKMGRAAARAQGKWVARIFGW